MLTFRPRGEKKGLSFYLQNTAHSGLSTALHWEWTPVSNPKQRWRDNRKSCIICRASSAWVQRNVCGPRVTHTRTHARTHTFETHLIFTHARKSVAFKLWTFFEAVFNLMWSFLWLIWEFALTNTPPSRYFAMDEKKRITKSKPLLRGRRPNSSTGLMQNVVTARLLKFGPATSAKSHPPTKAN